MVFYYNGKSPYKKYKNEMSVEMKIGKIITCKACRKKWINFTQNDRHFSGVVKVSYHIYCYVENVCVILRRNGVNSAAKCFPIKKVLIKGSILILAKFALFMEESFVSGVCFSVFKCEDYSLTYNIQLYKRMLILLWIGFKCDMWQRI